MARLAHGRILEAVHPVGPLQTDDSSLDAGHEQPRKTAPDRYARHRQPQPGTRRPFYKQSHKDHEVRGKKRGEPGRHAICPMVVELFRAVWTVIHHLQTRTVLVEPALAAGRTGEKRAMQHSPRGGTRMRTGIATRSVLPRVMKAGICQLHRHGCYNAITNWPEEVTTSSRDSMPQLTVS